MLPIFLVIGRDYPGRLEAILQQNLAMDIGSFDAVRTRSGIGIITLEKRGRTHVSATGLEIEDADLLSARTHRFNRRLCRGLGGGKGGLKITADYHKGDKLETFATLANFGRALFLVTGPFRDVPAGVFRKAVITVYNCSTHRRSRSRILGGNMFFEFRQYSTRPDKRAEWVKFMENEVIPFQVSKGMVVIGSFVDEEDEDTYYWIRRFKNEKERERLYEKVYQSEKWKNELSPQVGEMLYREKIVVKRLVATPRSVIQ